MHCATPRALGLYLRMRGIPSYALGDSSEMRVFEDPRIITNRFGGWASWHRTVSDYVMPQLRGDAEALGRVMDQWKPDVVVATSFAAAARLAATVRGISLLQLSIYPQHQRQLPSTHSFGSQLRRAFAEAMGLEPSDQSLTRVAWGVGDDTVLLHDPVLVDAPGRVVGFPYWDAGPAKKEDVELTKSWLSQSGRPKMLVTLGSFLGARQTALWAEAAKVSETLGLRTVFLGPRGFAHADLRADLLAVGFVPLSTVFPLVDAVVHHGGIGTTFAAVRAGRPAAIVPQAFDQAHNAALVDRVGVGIDASKCTLARAVERLLFEQRLAERATEIAAAVVPSEIATSRVVDCIVQLAEHGVA